MIGKKLTWGIPKSEETTHGLLVTSIDFQFQCDKEEIPDIDGCTCTVIQRNPRVSLSLSGYLLAGATNRVHLGDVLLLANTVPDSWLSGNTPPATTVAVDDVKYSYSNTSAVQVDISATIYPFGAGEDVVEQSA